MQRAAGNSTILSSTQVLQQRAARLGQWRASRWAAADAQARHRFLAELYMLRASAHRLSAVLRGPKPALPVDPKVHQAMAGVWHAIRTASLRTGSARESALVDREGDFAVGPPSPGGRSSQRPTKPRPTMRPTTPEWPVPIDTPRVTMPSDSSRPTPRRSRPPSILQVPDSGPPTKRDSGPPTDRDTIPPTKRSAQEMMSETFPELREADHALDPKRARRIQREKIRVERMRTDRAQLRTLHAERLRRPRRAALEQLRRAAPSAFRRALQVTPLASAPVGVLDKLASLAASDFAQIAWSLFIQNDGGTPIHQAAIAAAISTAIVQAATKLGVLDKVNASTVAKAVFAILSAEMPAALKVLATAAVMATSAKRPQREFEGEVDWEAFG